MVVEEGSHDELLEADGHYRRLVEHQFLGCKMFNGPCFGPGSGHISRIQIARNMICIVVVDPQKPCFCYYCYWDGDHPNI